MHNFFVCLIFLLPIVFSGCVIQPIDGGSNNIVGSPLSSMGFDSGVSDSGGYTIKSLDPLYIRFSGIVEQQALEVVVDENGEIGLLHINEPIKAGGMTTSALEKKIEQLYVTGEIYKNVSVNVTMTAKVFYIQGEVNQPGQFPLSSGTTLLQAIAGARGPTAFAQLKKVTIVRHGKVYTFDIKKLEKDPSLDVKIDAGDVIKVWQKWY